jgi:hypothetical protein
VPWWLGGVFLSSAYGPFGGLFPLCQFGVSIGLLIIIANRVNTLG